MKGYVYTLYAGADPSQGWVLNDPIFRPRPTLGACVPNIRRNVEIGDWLFFISGRVKSAQQYVIGGFRVQEKIDQLAAYGRFPDYRIHRDDEGRTIGNVIVNAAGVQSDADNHSNFERRLENYIVGSEPIEISKPVEIQRAREETLQVLSKIFDKEGNRPFDIVGRARKMDEKQVGQLKAWLEGLRSPQP